MSSVFSVSVHLTYYLNPQPRTLLFAATTLPLGYVSNLVVAGEHQDVQDKLRRELKIARDDGKAIDYDYLHKPSIPGGCLSRNVECTFIYLGH